MIPAFVQCFLKACGFGSVLCLNQDATVLAVELRKFGLIASTDKQSEEHFDFVVMDRWPSDGSEMQRLVSSVRKAIVLALPGGEGMAAHLDDLYGIGFRLHPRASAFELLSLRNDCQFCVVERDTDAADPKDRAYLQMAGSLWAEIGKLVSPRDRVLALGEHASFTRRVISGNSLAREVLTGDRPDGTANDQFDMIALSGFDCTENVTAELLDALAERLNPGGRLVLGIFSPDRQEIQNKAWLSSALPGSLIAEALYVPNESPAAVREPIWARYDLKDQQYWTEGWQAVVMMKSVTAASVEFPASKFPDFPFDDFRSQYDTPWLVRAMVSVQSRVMSARQLWLLADEIIAASIQRSDIAAAYCVKAYLILGQQQPWEAVQAFTAGFEDLLAITDETRAVDVRWAVSLLYVKALLEQKHGQRDKAHDSFRRCAESPFLRFAPMLATKTISACQQLAFMCLAEEDKAGAEGWFKLGVVQSRTAMGDGQFRSDPPYPLYVLPELSQVLGLGAQCNGALIALRQNGISPLVWDMMNCDMSSQIQDERLTSSALRQLLHSRVYASSS
ncbi:SAM-dependent methyltransferase [Rhizobium sp. BK313]|uniref:hypothetical protein n=1 Tax=Rhizobium sp. BK313 TaxID=2587081 RepID=UPI001061E0A6|nr:hypothetical protein [Rhizobium sp. BK313]MBB3457272.1 SAM-dependent methyltransferase [Rhizobium sp. BK313]